VDYTSYGGKARNALSRLDYGDHQRNETAGFARLNWNAAARLRILGGYRYQNHSLFGAIQVPEAGFSYWLTDRFVLSGSLSRGFRNPTIRELYLFPAPNAALQPENMWNYQGTFEARLSRSVQAWSTFYYADLKDQIVTLGRYPNLRLANNGSAINKGIDTNLRWRIARPVSITAGYAYLRSTNLAPLVPAHKLNVAADVALKRVRVSVGTMTVNSRFANAQKVQHLDGYTLATLKVSIPVNRQFTLFCLVDNALNKNYQVVQGYPMPGANAMGGMTVVF
jgi:outer membrane cobalamin receptor